MTLFHATAAVAGTNETLLGVVPILILLLLVYVALLSPVWWRAF